MAQNKEVYVINNLIERLFRITLYFKKGGSINPLIEYLKPIIDQKDVTLEQNCFMFKSKEPYFVLKDKYQKIFDEIKESNEFPNFLNFRLSFDNFKNPVTIFTMIQPYINVDEFVPTLGEHLNLVIRSLPENIKICYGVENKKYEFLSYALINNKKLLLTIDKELYVILNIIFAKEKNMFDMNISERTAKMTKDHFLDSSLFVFNYKDKDYFFKEFLNTCKICKNYHADYKNRKCYSICVPCGVVKEEEHICSEKSQYCGLCMLYHNKKLKHIPFDNECLHKKNIQTAMFINTRQKTLLKLFTKKIIEVPNEEFYIDTNDFPILKQKSENN